MSRILVTGGNGVLGRQLVPQLVAAKHEVSVGTRAPQHGDVGARQVHLDLIDGRGLEEAVVGCEVVIHAASDAKRPEAVDQRGTARLVEASLDAEVAHLVYVSIVGVDAHPLRYYRAKYAAELTVESSGVPHTILRATQFHDLVARFVEAQRRSPVVFVPRGVKFQVIETAVVAARLAELVERPAGRVQDMGGPEALSLVGLARDYLAARGQRRPVVGLPMPGAPGRAYRGGVNLTPHVVEASCTWDAYLEGLVAISAGAAA